MLKPSVIEGHLNAIEDLLKTYRVEETEVQRHLNYILGFPIFTFLIPAKTTVYRASSTFQNEFFSTISRISYPPSHKVTAFGRANTPQQSVFYCSEDAGTPFIELVNYWAPKISIGQFVYVTIGEWEITTPITALVVASPDPDLRKSNFAIATGNAFDLQLAHFPSMHQTISKTFYSKFYSWYSRPARIGKDIYKVTSLLSRKLTKAAILHERIETESIIYPSVANLDGGVNFAFDPSIVDQGKIKLVNAYRAQLIVLPLEKNSYTFKEVHRKYGRILTGGAIEW